MGNFIQSRTILKGFILMLAIIVGVLAPLQQAEVQAHSSSGSSSGYLKGTVTGFQGAIIGSDAKVTITDGKKYWVAEPSAKSGDYELTLPTGTYTVAVSATNYATQTFSNVKITNKNTTKLDAALAWKYGQVSGTVTNESKQPIEGAKVVVTIGSKTYASFDTNRIGKYAITLSPGTYTLTVSASGYTAKVSSNVRIEGNKAVTLDTQLVKQTGTLTGKVTGTSSAALKNATVSITGNGQSLTLKTGADGVYSTKLSLGVYTVEFQAVDYSSKKVTNVKVESSSKATTLNAQLTSILGAISGKVTDGNGKAIAGATVTLPELGLTATTDKDGKYAFYGIKPGKYKVEFNYGAMKSSASVQVNACNTSYVNGKLTVPKETVAPKTTAGLTPVKPEDGIHITQLTVTLEAADNVGGSGVNAIKYRIYTSKGWTQWMTYTGPFTVSASNTYKIEYLSTDKAGNQEKSHTIDFQNCGCSN
ncbi:5-hydroxyisourate hydrolase-like protein (transthyretin family) [Paenibacillus phyllosphaerae]|uniref:5-hydroxyisourate hydrolase-like protein (Transthyretin family) n=1 Tax=Paenibacillus phyllosphaerae TaxID=274593 RepID=A0A7W5B3S6_9BACL|nr:carboxypeptidase-like regulatory domain-containing protein [Paenibacillus phyllosphaerae]MBB3113883.1 5-hydroxyisourate hydrolase-like protein (transthyretin family) [Paenibacillus phyllosphaerae]